MKRWINMVFASLLLGWSSFAQGFVNLNFEAGQIQAGTSPGSLVNTASALPGWTVLSASTTFGTQQVNQVAYNTIDLGGGGTIILDTNNMGFAPLQGKYSVFLDGSSAGGPYSAAIGQTGQVPNNARSLQFFLSNSSGFQVTFAGQLIPLVLIGSTPNYDIVGGDISAFAGQSGQLLFTALPYLGGIPIDNGGILDNIQFSSSSIPEPSALALVVLGGWLGWRRAGKMFKA